MKAKDLWSAADKHVQKGDYIKLRDVTLGYTIPPHLLKKYMIQGIRLNVQIQNLWYWAANRNNLDPEVWNGSSLSPSRGSHLPANVTFGLSVNTLHPTDSKSRMRPFFGKQTERVCYSRSF